MRLHQLAQEAKVVAVQQMRIGQHYPTSHHHLAVMQSHYAKAMEA